MIDEHIADEKAAEKHFHVPATLLEVLSAPSDNVAGTWKCFSAASTSVKWAGRLWGVVVVVDLTVWWYCGHVVRWRWLPELQDKEKACKQMFTGKPVHESESL